MTKKRFIIAFSLAFLAVLFSLVYTEHPTIRPVSLIFNSIGISDSIYEIRGLTDIKEYDHATGSENANLILIEYSDYSCFWCASMRDVFTKLLQNKNVKLIYRHFYPENRTDSIRNRHTNIAIAAECVADLSGNKAFWSYTNSIYENQQKLNEDFMLQLAISLGIKSVDYKRCIKKNAKKIKKGIDKSTREVTAIGARGTPFILFVLNGEIIGFSYAITDYERFLKVINEAVSNSKR